MTARDNIIILRDKYNINDSVDSLLKKKQEFYRKLLDKNILPKKGLITLVKELTRAKYKLAIASSSGMEDINLILQQLKIATFFSVVVSGETIPRSKPYPDIFLKTAAKLKVKPQACLVLEDANSGVEAAYAANMKVIAIPNKYTRHADFSKASLILSSLEEVSIKCLKDL